MKKLFVIILIFVAGAFLYFFSGSENINPDFSNYRNSNLGISFSYPKILTASTTKNMAILHHEVPFVHHDFCDFKGEIDTTIDILTDFHISLYTINKNIIDSMKQESPYIPEENFVNGDVVVSPGFIDSYENGKLKGFRIFEGAEGCGRTIYYLKVNEKKTLVVIDKLITIFTGAIDTENMERALAVPGVINGKMAEEMLESILGTVKTL
mgnify:FL=1